MLWVYNPSILSECTDVKAKNRSQILAVIGTGLVLAGLILPPLYSVQGAVGDLREDVVRLQEQYKVLSKDFGALSKDFAENSAEVDERLSNIEDWAEDVDARLVRIEGAVGVPAVAESAFAQAH